MTTLYADVRVDYSHAYGGHIRTRQAKAALLELQWNKEQKKLALTIGLGKSKETFPLQPPMTVFTARISEGAMTLQLESARLHCSDPLMRIQVFLSKAEPEVLSKLQNVINICISRTTKKSVQPLIHKENKQVSAPGHAKSQMVKSSNPLKRKADSMQGPATSFISNNSRGAAGEGVTSKLRSNQEEELLPLSLEQQRVVDIIIEEKNIFFTGVAGTGKSLVLKHVLKSLPKESTFVTASTGLAASALGGTTLHAFSGISRASDLATALKLASRHDARQRWLRARTLIVDEVSMVDGDFFELLEAVARRVRGREEPFGGLQLVLCGDFHQLPPVAKGPEAAAKRRFCFETAAWEECIHSCLQLSRVYRQESSEFVDILAQIRKGTGGEALVAKLRRRCSQPVNLDGIVATQLFTHREDVDALNERELGKLESVAVRYNAEDVGSSEALKSGCPARSFLELKVGAQVMLTRNVSQHQGLVNGARGVVEKLIGTAQKPVVRFANGFTTTIGKEKWVMASGGRVIATRVQIPLELAWGMSVHKSQGLTLDAVQINLQRAFEPGMAYVALSRVRSLEGLQIVGGIHVRALRAHPKVLAFYEQMKPRI